MARKPDIQYIGDFYSYGSAARQVAPKQEAKKAAAPAAISVQQEKTVIFVDPVALAGIVVAVAMLVMMVFSTMQFVQATEACEAMEDYVMDLRDVNIKLTHDYRTNIDWEYVKSTAVAIGMVPASQAEVMTVKVTVPQPEPEATFWDDVQWFFDGLLE